MQKCDPSYYDYDRVLQELNPGQLEMAVLAETADFFQTSNFDSLSALLWPTEIWKNLSLLKIYFQFKTHAAF